MDGDSFGWMSCDNNLTMSSIDDDSVTINDTQADIDQAIEDLKGWSATLHFSGVVDFLQPVDLFEYTKPQYRAKKGEKHIIKFDSSVYPPTENGLLLLRTHLSFTALQEGTALNSRDSKTTLTCFRCREYQKSRPKPYPTETSLNLLEEDEKVVDEQEHCDVWGVKFGIREHKFHRDGSYKRPGGLSDVRGSSTVLPLDSSMLCSVKLTFRIEKYGHVDGYIHQVTGFGESSHVHHCRPIDGDLPALKRHTSRDVQRLIKDGKSASTGSSALRYLVLKNKNVFVQKTTLRSIQLAPDFLSGATAFSKTGQSTASRLVNWLRVKAQDPDVGLRYTVLFHRVLGGDQYHTHPKGRPPLDRMSLDRVNESLQVQLADECMTSATNEVTIDPTDESSLPDSVFWRHFSCRKPQKKKAMSSQLFQLMEYMGKMCYLKRPRTTVTC